MKQDTYMVRISCSWTTPIKASSMEEAMKKAKDLYKDGKGRFPREYVKVSDPHNGWYQVVE